MDTEVSIVTVLVPAAGSGSRMGGVRKQYRELGGTPLLVHTLTAFDVHAGIDHIIVAVPSGDEKTVERMVRDGALRKITAVVAGGESRQASVAAGLASVPRKTDIVLVHDAVRPFMTADRIDAVIDAARRTGAAALAVPVVDTLRRGSDGMFAETIDRSGLFRMQTPQAFRRDWLIEAHRAARSDGECRTDDVALVQRSGRSVEIVSGSPYNLKITTSDDWALAEAIWMSRTHQRLEDP